MRFPDIPIMKKWVDKYGSHSAVDSLLSNEARTFKLFKHLGQKQVPLIPYWLTSPRGKQEDNNQPSRYNDRTVIGYKEGADDFQVSESFGGRIMKE